MGHMNASVFSFPTVHEVSVCGSVDDLKMNGCLMDETFHVRSNLDCSLKCLHTENCIGSFRTDSNDCRLVEPCSYITDNAHCDINLKHTKIFMTKCQHGGRYVTSYKTGCQCKGGWVGRVCERLATSCREIGDYGYPKKIQHVILIRVKDRVVKMQCIIFPSGIIKYSAFGSTGVHKMNFGWQAYKCGFYLDDDNYWLGLENMYELFDHSKNLNRMEGTIHYKNQSTVNKLFIWYHGFGVDDESKGYTYYYDKIDYRNKELMDELGMSAAECLDSPGSVPFSTWDNDNDFGCALISRTGWWFSKCDKPASCNPLGQSLQARPPPASHSHISLYGRNIKNSIVASGFQRLFFFFVEYK